jgi:hypothetical protein
MFVLAPPPAGKPQDDTKVSIAIKPPMSAPVTLGVTMVPVPVCAVPLLNVEPAGGFNVDPKIVVSGTRELVNIDHMPVVQGLPSCDPVKR